MSFHDLEKELALIDAFMPEALATTSNENEKAIVQIAFSIKKLETLDAFIREHCQNEDALKAFDIFSGIVLENLKMVIQQMPE